MAIKGKKLQDLDEGDWQEGGKRWEHSRLTENTLKITAWIEQQQQKLSSQESESIVSKAL